VAEVEETEVEETEVEETEETESASIDDAQSSRDDAYDDDDEDDEDDEEAYEEIEEPELTTDPRIEGLAYACAEAALDKKALDVLILDVRRLVSYTDYFILASGRNERQVAAIADAILQEMVQLGYRPTGREGLSQGLWGVLDYGDLVVHIFREDERERYSLERLWSDAPRLPLEVPAELRNERFSGESFEG